MLIHKHLAEQLNLTGAQVSTLLALRQYPAMNYAVSEMLGLYPRSQMRKRVLEPLQESGWIIFHSLPPGKGYIGAPRLAWSLNPYRIDDLAREIRDAELWAEKRLSDARLASTELYSELHLDHRTDSFGYRNHATGL